MNNNGILLVEENPGDVEHALRFLKRENINSKVVVIHDGAEVMDYLLGTGVYEGQDTVIPAVIIMSLKQPEICGLQVLWRLRNDDRTKLLPMIFRTSSHEEQDLVQRYRLGDTCYISKPLDFNQFCDAARQVGM